MTAIRTRGQPAATAAIRSFATGGSPHAVLLVGPPSVGKTTLALDLAAALLCVAPDPGRRPCGTCRGCRLVASGNHPDVHRLAPEGPGGQIRIGDPVDPAPGTVRRFIRDLALLPVEGGARVAVVEHADRLNEAAQDALLKTLEEPPPGVTILLAADDEERLLPTVRSRCARIRLGPVAVREIEALIGDLGLADAPTASRSARVAAGRPGLAIVYAGAPDLLVARATIARTLLDLLDRRPFERLVAVRQLHADAAVALDRSLAVAAEMAGPGAAGSATGSAGGPASPARGRGSGGRRPAPGGARRSATDDERVAASATGQVGDETGANGEGGRDGSSDGADADPPEPAAASPARAAAAERRRAAGFLIAVWRDVARDLAAVASGRPQAVRDPALLDDLTASAAGLGADDLTAFLRRVIRADELLEANAAPELLLDTLVLAWPAGDGG